MSNVTSCTEPQNLVSSILKPVLVLEFSCGLPGNVFALWILFFRSPWKACNVYLLCLVAADVLLLLALPFHIHYLSRGEDWLFGENLCRFVLYITSVNYSASMAFMSLLAVDRFLRIVHPHHRMCRLSVRPSLMVVSCVWVAVLLVRLPPALIPTLQTHKNSSKLACHGFLSWTAPSLVTRTCNSVQLTAALTASILLLCCFLRVSSHVRGRPLNTSRRVKRTVRLLLFLLIVFGFCFLPTVISGIILQRFTCSVWLQRSFSVSLALSYMNGALDAVIYCHSNAWFRDTLKKGANALGRTQFQLSAKSRKRCKYSPEN